MFSILDPCVVAPPRDQYEMDLLTLKCRQVSVVLFQGCKTRVLILQKQKYYTALYRALFKALLHETNDDVLLTSENK